MSSKKYSYCFRNIIIFAAIFLSVIFIITSVSSCNAVTDFDENKTVLVESEERNKDLKEFDKEILVITGSTTLLEVSLEWAEAFMAEYGGEVTINGGGSGEGIKSLIHRSTDLTNSSRSIQKDEIDFALANNIAIRENIVLVDGIAVITSKNVNVGKLSFEQLSKIYKGEIVNWSEVGGHDKKIVAAARDSTSGTGEYFLEKVLQLGNKDSDDYYSEKCILFQTNAEMANLVSQNEDIIGYLSLGYLNMIEDMVNTPKIYIEKDSEAAAPSIESVKSKYYPISRDLYIYADENRFSDIAKTYLDFVYSEKGQQIGARNGFVPVK